MSGSQNNIEGTVAVVGCFVAYRFADLGVSVAILEREGPW